MRNLKYKARAVLCKKNKNEASAFLAVCRKLCMAGGPVLEPVWRSGPGDPDYDVSARNRVDFTLSGRSRVVRISWSRSPHRLQTWPPGHTQNPKYKARALLGKTIKIKPERSLQSVARPEVFDGQVVWTVSPSAVREVCLRRETFKRRRR